MSRASIMGELLVPMAVVSVVGMMIFPLPSIVLDALLTCNITFSLALLVSAVYLSEPEHFTALPSILLLTTLFRLGLNISTTRQILSGGEAPEIVSAFGHFVVGGNMVVGVVIFTIITVIQFLVISKGAERVAEVAARFTLDAMPGKQMAVDADLRSGVLTLEDAKRRRQELHREAKLYGALDGSMKFIKGDAIAGLLITTLNISAGLVLGITQQGLSLSDAIERYCLLTVGDGLVSQLPALLVSVAAGIAVTRVSENNNSFIGRDVLCQLGREPKALATTGVVLCCLALVPGLPTGLFMVVGVLFCYGAKVLSQARLSEQHESSEVSFIPKVYSTLVLALSPRLALLLHKQKGLPRAVQQLREEVFKVWGVVIPDVHFDVDMTKADYSGSIFLHGVVVKRFDFNGRCSQAVGPEQLNNVCIEIEGAFRELCSKNLTLFLTDSHTRQLMEIYFSVAEDLINAVVPEMISVTGLTKVISQLVEERVPIREFGSILQAIAEYYYETNGGKTRVYEANGALLHNELQIRVRAGLKQTITGLALGGGKQVRVVSLVPELDEFFALASSKGTPVGNDLVRSVCESIRGMLEGESRPAEVVILASKGARRLCFEVVSQELNMMVISSEEIDGKARIELIGAVGFLQSSENELSEDMELGELSCLSEAA